MTGRCAFVTFGCKINNYDTQAIREAVLELGYEEAAEPEGVDVVVVNSCTVTGRAGEKSAASVRRLARGNPGARIIVTGCMTEDDRRALAAIDGVAHIVGNEEKDQIPALLQGAAIEPPKARRRSRNIFNLKASRFDTQTRAFLKVHDGCDEFCSYCIIPFLRGKSKSRSVADVVAEAARLAESGHRELVLTGIHLSRYGRDLGYDHGLVELVQSLRQLPGVLRVRLSSIGEGAFSDAFVAAFAEDPGLCRFFHIPLQSGSDSVLQRMRRDYDVATYLGAIDRIRGELSESVIATDFMVGFPGETEAEFAESLVTCERVGFAKMHIFPYSVRPGTKAARLPDHVSPQVIAERMERARELAGRLADQEMSAWQGRTVRVLVEKQVDGIAQGLSRSGLLTRFAVGSGAGVFDQQQAALWLADWRGQEVTVEVSSFDQRGLRGQLVGAAGVAGQPAAGSQGGRV